MICGPSRDAALRQLQDFLPGVLEYARDRNHVRPGHPSVSRLSPAIRHRLISEREVTDLVLRSHRFTRVEKFIQEVYWRRYWKSWLFLRPGVWAGYRQALQGDLDTVESRKVTEARTGNRVIDHFAKELVETGYLHNHARMWFAAWWVHEARLPWQAGADFFHRHLLDGDPASNTLSWRWVAGMHTPGKTYLARRSNLEKYLAPELTATFGDSLAAFENPQPVLPAELAKPPITHQDTPPEVVDLSVKTGLWIHEEDLSVETTALNECDPATILVTADSANWQMMQFPPAKTQWLTAALRDAAARAERAWQKPVVIETDLPTADALLRWATASGLEQVVAMRPEIGPLNDDLPALRDALEREGIRLVLLDRPEDRRHRPLARGGFFQFWEHMGREFTVSALP